MSSGGGLYNIGSCLGSYISASWVSMFDQMRLISDHSSTRSAKRHTYTTINPQTLMLATTLRYPPS